MTDKPLPKRPLSAYMLWLNSARESIKSENPGMKVTDVAKKGGELWNSMKDKTEWVEKAAKAKEQYAKDLELYNANGGGGEGGGCGKEAQKRGKKDKKAALAKSKKNKKESEDDSSDSSL